MPKFAKPETTKLILPTTKNLPAADQAWVEVRSKIFLGDIVAANAAETLTERGLITLTRLIVGWNYVDDKDQPLPINLENINHLEKIDYEFLDKWINDAIESQQEGLSEEEKKDSSVTSIPVLTDDSQPSTPQPTT